MNTLEIEEQCNFTYGGQVVALSPIFICIHLILVTMCIQLILVTMTGFKLPGTFGGHLCEKIL